MGIPACIHFSHICRILFIWKLDVFFFTLRRGGFSATEISLFAYLFAQVEIGVLPSYHINYKYLF